MSKKQLFKVFNEQRREDGINEYISQGWKVVHFTSHSGGSANWHHWICVLFERDEE